jgi:hypothetical protein
VVVLVRFETSGMKISVRRLAILTEVIGGLLSPAMKIMRFELKLGHEFFLLHSL